MLESWLYPVSAAKFKHFKYAAHQAGSNVIPFKKEIPKLPKGSVALLGLDGENANAVRKHLYELAFPFKNLKLYDLGNVRKNEENFIAPILQELLEGSVIPVLIGGGEQLMLSQFYAHKAVQSSVNMASVDERIRYVTEEESDEGLLNQIFKNRRTGLFHFSAIGFQSHFTDPSILNVLEKRHFDYLRFGKIREDITQVEPFIRDADCLTFHLSALKAAEAPAQEFPSPNGFFGEEACQVCRYAGFSDKMRSFGIYGMDAKKDKTGLTAQLTAQMIWYFLEGVYVRKNDFPASNEGLIEYIVDLKDQEHPVSFWKSTRTGRWWVQVPVQTSKKQKRHQLVPCSFSDYQQACQDEVPERLLNAFKRFD